MAVMGWSVVAGVQPCRSPAWGGGECCPSDGLALKMHGDAPRTLYSAASSMEGGRPSPPGLGRDRPASARAQGGGRGGGQRSYVEAGAGRGRGRDHAPTAPQGPREVGSIASLKENYGFIRCAPIKCYSLCAGLLTTIVSDSLARSCAAGGGQLFFHMTELTLLDGSSLQCAHIPRSL